MTDRNCDRCIHRNEPDCSASCVAYYEGFDNFKAGDPLPVPELDALRARAKSAERERDDLRELRVRIETVIATGDRLVNVPADEDARSELVNDWNGAALELYDALRAVEACREVRGKAGR